MKRVTRNDFIEFTTASLAFIIHVIAQTIMTSSIDYYPIKISGAMTGYYNYHNSTKIIRFDQFTLMGDLNNLHTNQNVSTIEVQLTSYCTHDNLFQYLVFFLIVEICGGFVFTLLVAAMSNNFGKPIHANILTFIVLCLLSPLIDIGFIVFGYETINYLAYQQIYAIKGSVHGPISPTYNFSNQYDFIEKLCDLKLHQRNQYYQLKIDEIYALTNIYLPIILLFRILTIIILIRTNIIAYFQYYQENWSADDIDKPINETTPLTDNPINETITLTDN